jgi:hypothetical protein
MADRWVQCTSQDGGPIVINLGNALTMRRLSTAGGQNFTFVHFTLGSGADDRVSVQETPDQILKLKAL